jgi:hypothetical protein
MSKFRVIVVGRDAKRLAEGFRSHGWGATEGEADRLMEQALDFMPHAAVIDLRDVDEVIEAGKAFRRAPSQRPGLPLHGLPLLFVGGDAKAQDRVRSWVAAPMFTSDTDLTGELWKLTPRAR